MMLSINSVKLDYLIYVVGFKLKDSGSIPCPSASICCPYLNSVGNRTLIFMAGHHLSNPKLFIAQRIMT